MASLSDTSRSYNPSSARVAVRECDDEAKVWVYSLSIANTANDDATAR